MPNAIKKAQRARCGGAYLNPAPLERRRQEDLKFRASLCHTARACLKSRSQKQKETEFI
jgi:hypothetical protein